MPSTVIQAHCYDAERETLDILFTTGRRYLYFDVPPEAYAAFMAAFSKGRHFNRHIRDSYAFVEQEQRPALS